MKNIRICHLFKPVTQNQYSRHPTHSLIMSQLCVPVTKVVGHKTQGVGLSLYKIVKNTGFVYFFVVANLTGNLSCLIVSHYLV